MFVIVGLGNPGLEYYSTRHNAGFRVIDELGIKAGAHFTNKKNLSCDLVKTEIANQEVLLVKPTTFMNHSGRAVQAVLRWYKIPSRQLLVIHDEVALPLGRLRWQENGGAGGHHGIESIIECLGGDKSFDRLRIGVGPDPGGDRRADFVLCPIPAADRDVYLRCLEACAEGVRYWLTKGTREAMNRYNGMQLDPRVQLPADKDEPGNVEPSQP